MLKRKSKGQIVSKFDLGLLNAYKLMHFDRNISEKGYYLSFVTNGEFHFSNSLIKLDSFTPKDLPVT